MPNNIPEVMCGVYLKGYGGFEKLEYRTDIKVPEPKAGEVLIKVGGASVNNTDINTRIGWYSKSVKKATNEGGSEGFVEDVNEDGSWTGTGLKFPRIQGADAAGFIVAVGEGVHESRIGERVLIRTVQEREKSDQGIECITWGSECDGGFAEYATAISEEAFKVDTELTDTELSTFSCSYGTAENLVCKVGVNEGDVVLITGASGGVGSALVQLCKIRRAKVIGICEAGQEDMLKELGASRTIIRGTSLIEEVGKMRVDVVLDVVAGDQWPELLEILKKGGKYGTIGAIGGPLVELDVRTLYLKDLSLVGCTYQTRESFLNLISYIEKGLIKPAVAKVFPLKDIVEAQKAFISKKYLGKIALDPTQK